MCAERLDGEPCDCAECLNGAADSKNVEHEKAYAKGTAEGKRQRSAREIIDAYYLRLYNKYKEKYEHGIFTR